MTTERTYKPSPQVVAERRTACAGRRADRARTDAAAKIAAAYEERDLARADLADAWQERDRWRRQAERLAAAMEVLKGAGADADAPKLVGSAPSAKAKDADMLYGMRAIAGHLGWTVDQAKHRAAAKQIPTFKMGGTVCGLRLALNAWLTAQEGR